jgi:diguanylate cyclase (GGDEF)-like protein/PAS domain S-box-containing protein
MAASRPIAHGALKTAGERNNLLQLQTMSQAFCDLYFRLRADGVILEYSAPRKDDLFVEPSQFLNRPMQEVLPPAVARQFKNAIRRVKTSNASASIEYSLPMQDGTRFFEARLLPLPQNEFAVVVRDVTGFARAMRERDRLAAVLEATPDYVGICNREGGDLYLNRAARLALGIGEDEDISSLSTADLHPASASQFIREVAVPYAVEHGVWIGESVMLHRDGHEIPISHVIISHRNAAGEVEYFSSIARDISAQKKNEAALREAEGRYRSIFENAIEGIFQTTPEGKYTAANPMLARIYGYDSPAELMDAITDIQQQLYLDPSRRKEFARLMKKNGAVARFESPVRRKDGAMIWISENARAVRDEHGALVGYEGTVVDITERKQIEQQLKHQAFHDALTGLPNRILFMDRLEHALARLRRKTAGKFSLAILFLDLDRFKVINDSLGHESGDRLLVEAARRVESCLRPGDTAARLGGDEFTILLEDVDDVQAVIAVAERTAQTLQQPLDLHGHDVYITTSIGIAFSSGPGDSAEALLRDADVAMYRAKSNGRAQYEVFDPEMNARALERLHLESDLRLALEREEMCLNFQPKLDLESREIVAFEALLRWQHPTHGMVSPGDFIPLAEETGLILPIGNWVMRQACLQGKAWHNEYSCEVEISVNLSARQLRQPDLAQQVEAILSETGWPANLLKLEITESAVMEDAEHTIRTLRALYDLGVRLSIDDFGTGYSSLSYLSRFPITTLKVDRSFVSKMGVSVEDNEIVRAILMLAQALKLETVAEGIETEEQLNDLKALGCNRGQGFLFSRPLAAKEAGLLLKSSKIFENQAPG